MDLFCTDKKLSELGGQDFEDLLDQDVFTPPPSNSSLEHFGVDPTMDQDWLENFFEDPVLNDRMISDALQPPQHVQSEHSYSLSNSEQVADFGLPMLIKTEPLDKDNDPELLGTVNPNMTMTRRSNEALPTVKTENAQAMDLSTLKPTAHPVVNQPTIILATSTANTVTSPVQKGQETLVIPNVNIKVEPMEIVSQKSNFNLSPQPTNNYGLPPTPPCSSSSSSDSEGGQSPRRSAPPSPIHHSPVTSQHHHDTFRSIQQPLFTSPIPTSGVLILSEEEKRTLISEGYPIPGKLPLTKQEEKNLKKIRRKIKNKISAQESRRKKKEYLETLEKRMEVYSQENTDLRKKVDSLENNNRSLLSQLQKLQGLVAKVARPSSATSTQTGTCLMVLVLCFAVFLGTWSPMNWSLGYRSVTGMPSPAHNPPVVKVPLPHGPPMGPEIKNPIVDAYLTPSKRSRVLLSVREENEDDAPYGPHAPLQYNYKNIFMHWFSSAPTGGDDTVCDEAVQLQPELPKVQVLDVETENNQTGEDRIHYDQGNMHPDIAADLVGKNPTNAVA